MIPVVSGGTAVVPVESRVKSDFPKYWERDYINAQIDRVSNPGHKVFLTFLWMSGLRVSEAVGLRKKDLDFNNYVMIVRWLKNRKYNNRVVPIHPLLKDLLQLYTSPMNLDDRIFPFTRIRAYQITKKALNGSPHQLRHSFAVNWLRCGGTLVTLSRILGHSNINTTLIYLRIVPIDQGKELIQIKFR